MQKKIIKGLIKILILIMLFLGISFFVKADMEARNSRNYIVSKNTMLKLQPRTSGCIYFKKLNGRYRIIIKLIGYSNMLLNDSIKSSTGEIYYPDMSPGKYIYDIHTEKKLSYEQCFLTTTMSAKLSVEIVKK